MSVRNTKNFTCDECLIMHAPTPILLYGSLLLGHSTNEKNTLPARESVIMSSFDDIDRLDCLGVDIKGCLEAIKPLSANDGKCLKTARELLTNTLCLNDNSNTFTRCTTIVTCLKIIQETGDNDDLIQAIEDTADCYRNNPLFFQIVLLERMRTSQFFLIPTLFATRFHAVDDSFPRHLLFDNTFTYKKLFKICNYHLLGFGENTYYNYGVPTKGATKRAHQIGFRDTEITKVSMSNQHTLFLDSNNQVHGCGSSSKGQLGFVSGTIAVTPSLIELPDLGNEIVIDILAMEGFSIILTQRSIYICGDYKKIVPDSNNFQIKKYVLFESIDCYDMTITANTDYICIYALKLVFLCGFLSDEYTPPFMKYCRDTFINQNYNYIKNKGYKRSDSFDQNNFDAKNIDHRYQALPSFETNSGNHRRVALQYSRGQRYEFLFCIMSPLVYSNPDLISQHRTFEIYLKSGETVPHVFLLNGFRVHLNIWQFEVSKEGDIIVLAQTYKSQMDDSNGSMGACLYRGTFSLRKRKTRFDQEFIFAAPKNDVEALMRKSYWEIYLEEIMNSHGATFLSASPDLKNIIYKVEADQSFNDNDWGQLKWRSMNFQYLRSIQKEEIEESQDIVKVVSKENVDFTTTIEMIGYRVPALLPFVRNGVLDFSEAAKVLELSEECHAIYRFLAGFPFSQSFYEKLRRNVSVRPGPLLKTIGQCGITIRKQGQSSIRLYNTGDAGDVVPNDCTLISADGLRFQSNQKWLRLHSHYISLALNYSSENTLSLDYSGAIIQRVLNFLERPELLLDCSFDEIYQVFGFCDQYMFEALTQDCLQALFYRATHVNCEELFNFYFTLPSFHDLIVNLFLDRIDLLCFYPNSALAPIDLLREIEPLVETSANPSCAINALALDQNFTCKHDDFSMVLVTDETFRKTLKGNTKNQKIKKEVDEIVKCCASSGFLEFTLKSSLIFYEFDSHYTDQVCADFLEKYKRAQEKVLASKAKSPKDKKKKKDSCSPMEPPPSLPRPFPDPRVTLEQHFPTSPCVTDTQSTSSETTNTLPKPAEVTQITSPCLLPEPGLERNCTSLAMLVLDDEDVSTPKETKSPFLEKIQKVMKPKLKPMGKGHKADHLLLEKIPNGAPWAKASSPGPSTSLAIIQAEELERELHQVPENPEPRSRRAVWKSESEEGSHNLSFSQIMHEEKVKTEDEKKKFSRPLAFIEEEEKAAKELQQLYEQNVGDEMMVSVDFEKEQQKDPVWVSSISRRF